MLMGHIIWLQFSKRNVYIRLSYEFDILSDLSFKPVVGWPIKGIGFMSYQGFQCQFSSFRLQ